MTNKKKGNIIPFPHLLERHLELALEARDKEDYEKARIHLEQALALEPGEESALFGLVVTYHDLGRFDEAGELAERMLRGGQGEYLDVLRLYVISLIQLEKYGKVCEILSSLLTEQEIPTPAVPEFQEILRTCELLMESRQEPAQEEPILSRVIEEKLEDDPHYLNRLIKQLEQGDFDRQLQALEQLKFIPQQESIDALRSFLVNPQADGVLKTFALGALKGLGASGTVFVEKKGKRMEMDIADLPDLEQGLGGDEGRVADLIAQKTYHEDPMFSSFALQLWLEFFYAAYPFHPGIKRIEGWAAALHYATNLSLGKETTKKEIAELYGVSPSTLTKCHSLLDEMLDLEKRNHQRMKYFPYEQD